MTPAAPRWKIVAAFAAVYIIWGSTYLAIHWAVESIPIFLLAGSRFLIAGGLMLAWALARGDRWPNRRHWRTASVTGLLMLFAGNASVVWGVTRVPTGLVALIVAGVSLWITLFSSLGLGPRPSHAAWLGVAIGLSGIALLVGPSALAGGGVDPLAALTVTAGSMSWALGTLLARRMPSSPSPVLSTAMQMLCAGTLLAVVSAARGEIGQFDPARLTVRAVLAQAYLITCGSIIAFTAYVWLLRVVAPALIGTYAFVNPVVAVLLGLAFNREPLTPRTLAAGALIVVAVAIVTLAPSPGERPAAT